jgi:hypothetical protein
MGAKPGVVGAQEVTIIVTAADVVTAQAYTLNVTALGSDAIAAISVLGSTVSFDANGILEYIVRSEFIQPAAFN